MTSRVAAAVADRVLPWLMLCVFWAAFACLAAGLVVWLAQPTGGAASALLTIGLLGLLANPLLKLLAVIAASAGERDWLTLGATLAVLAILMALTLRDALRS